MRKAKQESRAKGYLVGLLGVTTLVLAGCNGSEDSNSSVSTTVTLPEMNSPATIATASADDYDDNTFGLITGNTLKDWVDDWANNKPAGIEGNLVILQTSAGEAGYEYVAPNGTDVFTYEASEWIETRSNGVISTRSMVPSGQSMDNFLSKYNIDPTKDMIVCAQGTGGAGQAMRAGRCWYMFRYWGVPAGRLAMLNGGNQWNGDNTALTGTFTATASTPPMTGFASVKDLPQINFALQATLEDMLNVVPDTDTNVLDDGIFIWDARGNNLPVSLPDSGSDEYSPDGDSDFRNGGSTQGHPNGALLLAYNNLFGPGYTYKSKAELEDYLDGGDGGTLGVDDGEVTFVDGTLQGLGVGQAYQDGDVIYTYCETTFRAMVTGFATAAILGKPTRFYDGAMVEWHSMANAYDKNGDQLLPAGSPWRTDKNEISMFRVAGDAANVDPRTIVNPYANTANQIIIEDLAYKGITVDTGDSGSTGGDTGGAPVPNGCG